MLKSNIRVGDLLMTDTVPYYIYLDSGQVTSHMRWTRSVMVVSLDASEHTHLPGRVVVIDGDQRVALSTADMWDPDLARDFGYIMADARRR